MKDAMTPERQVGGNGKLPAAPGPSGLPARRRWGRVAAGAALFVVWLWGTAALVMSSGDRSEVLIVANDVDRLDQISRGDLRAARLGVDNDVGTVAATDLDDMVGRYAATELVAGSVLSPSQVVPEGERIVGDGEAVVGARLKPAEIPSEGVTVGADVLIVLRPVQGGTGNGEVSHVAGWLMALGDSDPSTGERSASLVVPASAAPGTTAAAADGRVSVVLVEA